MILKVEEVLCLVLKFKKKKNELLQKLSEVM